MNKKKNSAAVALGRKGGKAAAKKLTDEQRREKARRAARAKWAKGEVEPAASWLTQMKLTNREQEIAEYATRGHSNAAIAQHFRIALNTVKKHLGHAFEKLGVTNRTELAVVLVNERNDAKKRAPQLDAYTMGSILLEATKEAYEMAEYLTGCGQPGSDAGR